jgi:hypothetical protein
MLVLEASDPSPKGEHATTVFIGGGREHLTRGISPLIIPF